MLINSPASKFRIVGLEQYYTPRKRAQELYDLTIKTVSDNFANFVEPSAGIGSFFYCMPKLKRIGFDLEYNSSHPDIIEQDFFDIIWPKGSTITIGNPPFGRRGKLAMQFLNISCENSDVVAMILPAIFSKYTFINRVHPFMHLICETEVNEFITPSGDVYPVKCLFQIWKKSDTKREKIKRVSTSDHFTMTHRHISRTSPEEFEKLKRESTVAIKQIGGRVVSPNEITKGSVWFIKGGIREIFDRIDHSHLHKHHVGAISLTKADLVEGYLREYNKDK